MIKFIECLCLCLALSSIAGVVASKKGKKSLHYDRIFNFGDSISDTGNLLISIAKTKPVIGALPYGQTHFHKATGRCCDGRLMIDFIAEESGLPYLPPYLSLGKKQKSEHGVNFAVAGSTALDASFFKSINVSNLWTNLSLSVQMGWFKRYKSLVCSTEKECEKYFKNSLFLAGEIGGNDFNYGFMTPNATLGKLRPLVPKVVDAIAKSVTFMIEEGHAKQVIVPGNFPIGCNAPTLTMYASKSKSDYDSKNGCLKSHNQFAKYFNEKLKGAIEKLRTKHPETKIMYADYYGAALRFFDNPKKYGFVTSQIACCGGGGPFNYNPKINCGRPNSRVCKNPATYANWDGIHLTEAAYKHMVAGLIHGPYMTPSILETSKHTTSSKTKNSSNTTKNS